MQCLDVACRKGNWHFWRDCFQTSPVEEDWSSWAARVWIEIGEQHTCGSWAYGHIDCTLYCAYMTRTRTNAIQLLLHCMLTMASPVTVCQFPSQIQSYYNYILCNIKHVKPIINFGGIFYSLRGIARNSKRASVSSLGLQPTWEKMASYKPLHQNAWLPNAMWTFWKL